MSHDIPRWEYRTVTKPDENALNALGADGWELVGIENGVFYMKRRGLDFRERVTLEQKRRYYALWGRANDEEAAP